MANPFTVLGDQRSHMHGRKKIFRRILDSLLKPDPDHVQLVGPKYIGKSTLLSRLVEEFPIDDSSYVAVSYWNFRQTPVADDNDFADKLCHVLKEALKKAGDEAVVLFGSTGNSRDEISAVLKELDANGSRFLLILDEFDTVFSGSELTRNFWDWLRAQGKRKSFRIVTSSRLPLQELCKPETVKTSDFWNLFPPMPTLLKGFDGDEWEHIIAPLSDNSITVDPAGTKAIQAWTGGVPLLVSLVLSQIHESGESGKVGKDVVDQVCEEISEYWPPCISDLWDDCGDLRKFLVAVASNEPLSARKMGKKRFRELRNRGFVDEQDELVVSTCRLMHSYAEEESSAVNDLNRLFEADDSFRRHFPKILEMRLAKIENLDSELLNYVRQAISDLYEFPGAAVMKLRDIAPMARNLVIGFEFPERDSNGNHLIPLDWAKKWKNTKTPAPSLSSSDEGDFCIVPEERWDQSKLFLAMTGARKCPPLAKGLSKSSALILSNLTDIGGGAGGHNEEYRFSFEFAAALCFETVVLCEHLAKELN